MSENTPDHEALSAEVNRLYWETEESVNQIGETLGLSKGALYNLMVPLASGLPCPGCGEEMAFPNRTARDKGFLVCPECGMEEEEGAVQLYWEEGEEEASLAFPEPKGLARRAGGAVRRAMDSGRDRVTGLSPRGRIIAGTALLGIAAGVVIGGYLRKR